MYNEVFFDVETKAFFAEDGKFEPAKLGVSICSVYTRKLDENLKEVDGELESYWEEDFERLWPVFQSADRIIGFNTKRFDVPALSPYTNIDLSKLPHFDILDEVRKVHGKRVSLNRIAKSTLNKGKVDDPKNAIIYWEKHDPESLAKLQKYCEEDVVLTREIYDFALEKGFLSFTNFWNTPFTIKVDFNYPKYFTPKSKEESQISLF